MDITISVAQTRFKLEPEKNQLINQTLLDKDVVVLSCMESNIVDDYKQTVMVRTYQQGAVVVQLTQQHAAIVEEVGRVDVAVKVASAELQPSIQLSVDVKLPGIAWLLNLRLQQSQSSNNSSTGCET